MTKFSFEVPIRHLNDFEDLQDFFFTLSFLYENPTYKGFHLHQRDKGVKTIWLDNSYNELMDAANGEQLALLDKVISPNKIISPDDPVWNKHQIAKRYAEMLSLVPQHKLVVVVKDLEMATHMAGLGAFHTAVSYWNRPKMTNLKAMMPCHFLGLLSIDELIDYRPPTCDTSMPIKLAMINKTIEQWEDEGCPHIYTHKLGNQGSDFFNAKLTTWQVLLARNNIMTIKERANGQIRKS